MKKKFLSILAAFAVLVSFSACQAGDTGQAPPLSEAVVSDATTQVETTTLSAQNGFETTYEITEWSADDFQSIECCGIDISLPCKLSDIDESFEVKISKANEEFLSSRDWFELYFDNEYVGALCYAEDNYNADTSLLTFIRLEKFNLYNLTEKSTKEEIQKKLGKGNKMDSKYADGFYGDKVSILFEYEDDLTFVSIMCEKEK